MAVEELGKMMTEMEYIPAGVTKDVPPRTVVAGVPAKVIKRI